MTDGPAHLALITAALDAASNPRLGTDTRLRHALTACDHLAKLAAYQVQVAETQEDRLRYLAAEIYLLRDPRATVS